MVHYVVHYAVHHAVHDAVHLVVCSSSVHFVVHSTVHFVVPYRMWLVMGALDALHAVLCDVLGFFIHHS